MAADAATTGQSTSTGLDENLAGALTYLPVMYPIIPVVLFLVENDNRFVKFHAVQSVLLGVAVFVLSIGLGVLATVLGFVLPDALGFGFFGLMFAVVFPLFGLASLLALVFLMYKAYQGEMYGLPVIGGVARSVAN